MSDEDQMENLGDETLASRLVRGPLSGPEVISLGLDLLSGLEAAHGKQLIRRDIKPSNIFLVDGRARIADFGIVPPSSGIASITEPGLAIGSPGYMAPEQLIGAAVSQQTDLYAVGVVLYEAATGRKWPPLQVPEAADWGGVQRRLAAVLRRALLLKSEDRWPSASDFRQALLAAAHPPLTVRTPALILALTLVIVVFLLTHRPPSRRSPAAADLAILPVAVQDSSAHLDGHEFARLMQLELEWFGRLRLTPISYVFDWSGKQRAETVADRAAAALDAEHVVAGELIPSGDATVLHVTVNGRGGGHSHAFTVRGDPRKPLDWSAMAADSVVRKVFPKQWDAYIELRRYLSLHTNREVYAHYFAGEDFFQRDAYNFAQQQYDSALAQDSAFVPALWRLAIVHRFQRVPFEEDLRRLHARYRDELARQNRELVNALLDPDLRRRFEQYRTTVDSFPRDGYARFIYADELFHRGPLIGIPIDTALAQFREEIAIEPFLDQMPAYDHLLYGYLRLGERERAATALDYRVHIPPSGEEEDRQRRAFFKLAYDLRFRPWRGRLKIAVLRAWTSDSTLERMSHFVRMGSSFDIPSAQLDLGRILAARGKTSAARGNGHRAQGLALMFLGRPMEALSQLDSASDLYGESDSLLERAEWRVMPGLLGLPGVADSARAWGLERLGQLARSGGEIGARASFAGAVDALAKHDTSGVDRWLGALGSPAAGRFALLLRSLLAAERGRTDSALALSEPLLSQPAPQEFGDPFARSVLYLHRIDWFLQAGDTPAADRARVWYQNSDAGIEGWPQRQLEPGEVDGMLSQYARLLQAEADLDRRRYESACPLVDRLRELWEDVEPGMRPLMERADRAAARCP